MRILLLTMQLGRAYGQGSERYTESLGAALASGGHEVSYLAGDPRGLEPPRPLGAPVDAERRLFAHSARSWFAVLGARPSRMAAFLRREWPDLVHVVNPAHVGVGAMLAARRLGIPVVVTAMDFWWVCPRATLLRGGTEPCSGSPGWRDCVRCIASITGARSCASWRGARRSRRRCWPRGPRAACAARIRSSSTMRGGRTIASSRASEDASAKARGPSTSRRTAPEGSSTSGPNSSARARATAGRARMACPNLSASIA